MRSFRRHLIWISLSSQTVALIVAVALAASPPASAATPVPAKTVAPADDISAPPRGTLETPDANKMTGSHASSSGSSAGDMQLWDYWYTVTVNKVVHYEYYNDHAEIKKGRIIFQNHAWKQEEDYINEEQLGVFCNYDTELTPLFYNFHSTYRSVETTIDGNVKDGRELSVRIRKGTTELPLIKKSVPPKTFFSEHFPVWLGPRLAGFKTGQVYPFQTILEDNLEADFMTINGQIRKEAADDIATKTHTTKLTINYNGVDSLWWVDAKGAPVRILMPLQKTVVERVSKEVAQKFLDKGN